MGWRDLLQTENETIVSPWIGGRALRSEERTWTIKGGLPPESCWSTFRLTGRKAEWGGQAENPLGVLHHLTRGYLVGDRFLPDDVRVDPDPKSIVGTSERIFLVEAGVDRFARVLAGRMYEDGPLVYEGLEMPLGPESDVLGAYLDQESSLDKVRGVPPALDAAFRMESWRRVEAEKRRAELEKQRREEEERRQREERRRQIAERLGDAAGRRAMAEMDFGEAARAALAVGGAQYLDHTPSVRRGEMVVRFRLNRSRFECVCDQRTMRIIDAGICLTDHESGERGDTYFTLESLPAVILQAEREGKLVVFRRFD